MHSVSALETTTKRALITGDSHRARATSFPSLGSVAILAPDDASARNDRNVRGTEFEYLPSRLNEPSPRVYGAMAKSLPPGAFSLYDSLGSVVVFYVRYDLGTIVYIGYQFDSPYQIDNWVRVIHAAMAM